MVHAIGGKWRGLFANVVFSCQQAKPGKKPGSSASWLAVDLRWITGRATVQQTAFIGIPRCNGGGCAPARRSILPNRHPASLCSTLKRVRFFVEHEDWRSNERWLRIILESRTAPSGFPGPLARPPVWSQVVGE